MISSVHVPLMSPALETKSAIARACQADRAFGPEVADVVRRSYSRWSPWLWVEDVPGGVVVEDRPDGDPGVTRGTRGETEHPDGIAAGKAQPVLAVPAALFWFCTSVI